MCNVNFLQAIIASLILVLGLGISSPIKSGELLSTPESLKFQICSRSQAMHLNIAAERMLKIHGSEVSWKFMHAVRLKAAKSIIDGKEVECARYPSTSNEKIAFIIRFKSMCEGEHCYTFIFDALGSSSEYTAVPLLYLGLTRGDFETIPEIDGRTWNGHFTSYPEYGFTLWVDFKASGRIRYMFPPISF